MKRKGLNLTAEGVTLGFIIKTTNPKEGIDWERSTRKEKNYNKSGGRGF